MNHKKRLAVMLILAGLMIIGYAGAFHYTELKEHPLVCQFSKCYFEDGNLVGWEPDEVEERYMIYRMLYGDDFFKESDSGNGGQ